MKPSFPDPRAGAARTGTPWPRATIALALLLAAARHLDAAPASAPRPSDRPAAATAASPQSTPTRTRRVEAFDQTTWAQLAAATQRPTVVVFSTTDCSHCPAVLQALHAHPARQQQQAPLVAVVMDLAPGEDDAALLAHPHYAAAQRLLAFDGPSAALRHSVNPGWRGMTPYVALLRPGTAPTFVLGMPDSAQLNAWAAGRLRMPHGAGSGVLRRNSGSTLVSIR